MCSTSNRSLLWLVCVNYNSEESTRELVKEFSALDGADRIRIAVVENSDSNSQSLQDIERSDGAVSVLRPENNLGYFGGAAFGLATLLKSNALPEWVAVANVDIVPSNGAFLDVLRKLSSQCCASVVAPAIKALPSKVNQNPYLISRPSYLRMRMYTIIYGHPLLFAAYEGLSDIKRLANTLFRKFGDNTTPVEAQTVYAPHGAFILFHRSYFEAGGDLEFGSFLFGEEFYVAERARQLKLEIRYEPDLSLIHHEHVVTGLLVRKRITRYASDSMRYLVNEFFSKK